ncbi:MAG: hypothetical protein COB24_13110 [Hyphomicrobiales bacterium]|nr:MAG: hypothetical protein COB24_13110 [Hyphomicrobiales bacterium]
MKPNLVYGRWLLTSETKTKRQFRKDGTPYYVQLAAIIRRQIAEGSWDIGDKLPTLKQMVATYGVSPMTVRQAIAGLKQEGLIDPTRGRGTFVIAKPETLTSIPYNLNRSSGTDDGAFSFRMVALRPANNELRITPEDGTALDDYQYMKRTFASDGRPYIVAEYMIAGEVFGKIPENLWAKGLISELLYDTKDVGLSHVQQKFRVISSMPQEAAELKIQTHDPVIQVRRIFLNAKKEILCLAQLVYRTDGVVFDMNIDLNDRDQLFELGGFPVS